MTPAESESRAGAGRWERVLLNGFAVLLLLLMLCICAQVLCSALDLNPLATFQTALPLLGRALTINSLLDLQWHLLVVIGLLPAGLVWRRDGHVRVDFLYAGFRARTKAGVDLAGLLVFTLPFLLLSVPAGWSFMLRAWSSSEMSPNGGLTDRFLVKSLLPAGLAILLLVALLDLWPLGRRLLGRR
ncbi:Tripartite ATP-independent transporter, DctQ component [Tistlia consotensis]|uniref:TRAP transporter small permease protein n=1 Tax=Tistlia consotensis USBA 355 TaxID=560819 RepID=A0A1Y6C678_9PROT|nr:TRAP transporter small permease subunit [Tistlia consotensis]SMF47689.1 Tripartite ATP-independent transporter, DctQ component [Tistlia consotensis USBA 355]SNR82176.1 Tripartite ATP-independent transporter, DctQ component [Tistlia consotensis]